MAALRGLPPANASGCCPGTQWDLQGYEASLITAVAEKKLLEEPPRKSSVHGKLEQNWLGARVRSSLTAAETEEELNKPAAINS